MAAEKTYPTCNECDLFTNERSCVKKIQGKLQTDCAKRYQCTTPWTTEFMCEIDSVMAKKQKLQTQSLPFSRSSPSSEGLNPNRTSLSPKNVVTGSSSLLLLDCAHEEGGSVLTKSSLNSDSTRRTCRSSRRDTQIESLRNACASKDSQVLNLRGKLDLAAVDIAV